ncbi:MAG: helix-turn-helix transcriptional regulator [Lacrimispora sp.]|uniref:helix-turn-helix domain-containing protein n=1 Tax=Lacrimispora sp. TaxID=2719234 RepID=UPI0039E38ECB
MKSTLEILRGLREDRDLKQSDIANLIGTTQQQYSKYETGESELPLRALSILADHYRVSADFLMGRTDCREGISALNQKIIDSITAGSLLSDVMSLNMAGRRAVLEYVFLQKLKQRYETRGKHAKKKTEA